MVICRYYERSKINVEVIKLRSFYFYSKFVFSLIFSAVSMFKISALYKKCEKKGDFTEYDKKAHEITSKWAAHRLNDTGSAVTVHGLENLPKDKNAVFISNHQSNMDILVLMSQLPVPKGFVAKIELGRIPLLSFWMKQIRCVFIDREDMKQSLKVILEGIELIKKGYSLVLFPEGTRSKNNTMGEFKAGGLKLATKPKALIVPVTIDGTYKIMEGNNNKITPALINLYIHPPIDTKALSKEENAALPERLHNIIKSKLPQ